ncbi:CpsD/CapB family tyrosine-protein kinase [Lutispora saccharofermentans]|uniref:CpsD/CapB family tyrosine-protein kinase n=1 Tax=Lutispora saccharofermentans TaxID=3024236 RepID=A0ABT1NAH2_9FIRM|nr:CpsD/CapB family tyrosine-protein kinase [Lutispora saccharofermentans]MCQ1528255.1 CpsD/CapB family tyrosine-protein kinase [Lutispora saccharofermentans]
MDKRNIITNINPKSRSAEAYRILRTNIQFANIDKTINSIVITSPGQGDGKSTVIANLAVAIARNNKKVLLIDADLRKPNVHTFFQVSNTKGLTNLLSEDVEYIRIIESTYVENLDILSSGPIPPNPSELLGSNRIKILLDELKTVYDMVLFDSPPACLVTDAAVLSTIADGVILVCAAGQTTIENAKNAKALLNKVNANIIGVVLNKMVTKAGRYNKADDYYSYYEGE